MASRADDTIFAVATGAVRAAICVVRVSGPRAREIARAVVGRVPPPRTATLARLRDPATDETLDRALVLFFEAAKSELGEDGIEFHLHGSPAVVAAVLGVLRRQPGARPAEPGEFARRAFANGKMDLTQLEGLADLIDAETEWQRRQAQRQVSGVMRAATAPWRAALIAAAAEVETAIDFAEDVVLERSVHGAVRAQIDPVRDALRRELAQAPVAERIRDGVQIVIAGPPNAGKSSLLNALVRREAAIVSALAGTTRDPIEVHLDLGGCPVTLVDTAGLRDGADSIEQIGIRRARTRAEAADLVLWLDEGPDAPPVFAVPVWHLAGKADLRSAALRAAPIEAHQPPHGEEVRRTVSNHEGLQDERSRDRLVVRDGLRPPHHEAISAHESAHGGTIEDHDRESAGSAPFPISAKTGHNLDRLVDRLSVFAQTLIGAGASGLLARARHREAFGAALVALDHVAGTPDLPVELMAEDLRVARFALDRLIGQVDVEDILGDIFSRFCIGK